MRVLLFGTETCQKCMELLANIQYLIQKKTIKNEDFVYIDAVVDENQDLCDTHNIDLLPHLKVYSDEGIITGEIVGEVLEIEKLKEIFHDD